MLSAASCRCCGEQGRWLLCETSNSPRSGVGGSMWVRASLVPSIESEELHLLTRMWQTTKCDILEQACNYIIELQGINDQLAESAKHEDTLATENKILHQTITDLKLENAKLLSLLAEKGLPPPQN